MSPALYARGATMAEECFRDLQGNVVDYEIALAEYNSIDQCQDYFWNCDTCLCVDDPQRHVYQHKHSPVTPEQQAWLESGPIKEDTLALWLSISNKEDTNG